MNRRKDDDAEVKLRTVKHAARQLGLSRSQIYRLIDTKKLEHVKLGARMSRVTQESIDRYIEALPRGR
jgi:excisionase family DNA binding protein